MHNFQVGHRKINNSFLTLVIIINLVKPNVKNQRIRSLKELHNKECALVIQ